MMVGDKAALYTAKRESGMDTSGVAAAWAAARGSGAPSWVAAGLDPAVKDKVVVIGTGDDGLAGLRAAMTAADGAVVFGAFPFSCDGASRKWAFVTWVGPAVSALKKGRVALQKAAVYNAFEGVVADIGIVSSADELGDAVVVAAVRKATGKADAAV
jgi:hypothetical protein